MILAKLLSKIYKKNGIILIDSEGQKYICGKPDLKKPITIKLLNKNLNWKLVLNPDYNFPEAYVRGEIKIENASLLDFLNITFENIGRNEINTFGYFAKKILHSWRYVSNYNLPGKSKKNVKHHYDIGEELYDLFLDKKHRQYSCAYFLKEDESLEDAQQNKINHIIKKLNLKPGQKILDIGCGWGSFAEIAARDYGCMVDGITISKEQLAYASKRIHNSGLSKQVNLFFQDYRDLEGKYDRIVSIEMLEAVGEKNWTTYFNQVKQLLKPDGEALIQTILIEDSRFEDYRKKADFIQRYIFPGGMLPSLEILKPVFSEYGLKLNDVMHFGNSYGKTMNLWNQMFQNAWSEIQHQNFDLRFKRMWEYYLAYCETGFNTGAIDVAMIHLQKEPS